MKSFKEYDTTLLLTEAEKKSEDWTPPLHGGAITKHLGKSHVHGIVADDDYGKYVKHNQHVPVFRVQKGDAGFKNVRVGNTLGDHFIEYAVNKAGTVHRKTVYARADGLHPKLRWSVHSTWKIEDEQDKKKGKK